MTEGRPNQTSRTRKDLLRAAARLIQAGGSPAIEEVAAEAMVSRATAYRHFPGTDALLAEAALDVEMPSREALFEGEEASDPVTRLLKLDAAMQAMLLANEAALRAMLARSLQQRLPVRQNRRTPLIEAALAPARTSFAPWAYDRLVRALALVIGTEAMIACKDVLAIGEEEADSVRRWMIRSLVEAAQRA